MEVLHENEEEGTPRVGRDFDALALLVILKFYIHLLIWPSNSIEGVGCFADKLNIQPG